VGGEGTDVAPEPAGNLLKRELITLVFPILIRVYRVTIVALCKGRPRLMKPESLRDIAIIDVDTHLTEPHDLWTSRAPVGWEDRVPQVHDVDGRACWTIDGEVLGNASAGGVVRTDGSKALGSEFIGWSFDEGHPGASQVGPRVELMDQLGIWAQIVYPNIVGFGGQRFTKIADRQLRELCVTIWNDAMAEMQEESGQRLFPMALLPWWDLDKMVSEAQRAKDLGLRGVILNADPQEHDSLADLGDPYWAACSDLGLPVNFHIGASDTQQSWFGSSPWPSHDSDEKLALGSAMIYLGNARVLGNLIFSGVLERFGDLRFVSVESGIGWIPFTLEALDYQIQETAPRTAERLSMRPSDYFHRQVYGCFWFEQRDLAHLLEVVGVDNCMFETDFPHPTCLYPDSVNRAAEMLATVPAQTRMKVLSSNAADLYSIRVPELDRKG
jgi:predicted TIM-barrel fold metal-dependent hydrolase